MNDNSKAGDILARMTTEEKAALVSGQDEWTTKRFDRFGIRPIWVSDGPHGLRRSPDSATGGFGDQLPATCFPTASALAATWNEILVEEVGTALGDECRDLAVDVLLGPGINIKRSPLGGRNFEYFSEDPLLAGKLGAAYVRGVQSRGVGTSLKHFACNSQETRRMMADSRVDERALREIYLRNFEIAVKEGNPWTIMASYNPVNGEDATANRRLLTEILREEWDWEGVAVSDWQAVYDRVAALAAGLDLEMPGNGGWSDPFVSHAVAAGEASRALLDRSARRVLELIAKAGPAKRSAESGFNGETGQLPTTAGHRVLAERVASESITLLKNDRGTLPIDTARYRSVALIGEFSVRPRIQGNGSSEVKPLSADTLRESFLSVSGSSCTIRWAPGYSLDSDSDLSRIDEAVQIAKESDMAVIHAGLPNHLESEGIDREDIDLPEAQNRLIEAVAATGVPVAVVLTNGSAVAMPWVSRVDAVLETWLPGEAGGTAIARALLGETNPSGKLAETFPARLEDTPAFLDLPSRDLVLRFAEGIFTGYRWYDARKIEPLFPFGHGLSYTEFGYSALELSRECFGGEESITVSCAITNTGRRAGAEVAQLYIADPESALPRPARELRAFTKVYLDSGESRRIEFTVNRESLQYWHDGFGKWIAESGIFRAEIGSSSRDIRLSGEFRYASNDRVLYPFSVRSCMRDLIRYPELRAGAIALVKPFFDAAPGLYQGNYEDFNVTNPFFVDMPIEKYVRLSHGAVSRDAVEAFTARARSTELRV